MGGLKKTTMKEQVYELVRSKILNQDYPFGSRINIDTLAEELHVSNSPIREALIMLENDGLLTMRPNAGARVIEFNENSYQELNTAICTLLFGTYEICVLNQGTDKLADMLSQCIENQKHALDREDLNQMVVSAMDFDKSFFATAENRYLSELYDRMESVIHLQILDNYQRHYMNMNENIHEHEMIMLAARSCDTKEMKFWLQRHYDKHIPPEM